MEKKFKTAIILMFIPVIINTAVSIGCLVGRDQSEFAGYLAGTILSFVFSVAWVIIARKVSISNIMVLFTVSLGSFPVKIFVFAVFAFGGFYIFQMSQLYFGISFLFGVVVSLIVEVWFILSVNKLHLLRKAKDKKIQGSEQL